MEAVRPRPTGPARCVYCRDDVVDRDAVECPGCRVVLHAECAALTSRCPTLGCATAARRSSSPAVDQAATFVLSHLARSRLAAALCFLWLVLGSAALQLGFGARPDGPTETIIEDDAQGRPVVRRLEPPRAPPYVVPALAAAAGLAFAAHVGLAARAWARSRRDGAGGRGRGHGQFV